MFQKQLWITAYKHTSAYYLHMMQTTLAIVLGLTSKYHFRNSPPCFDVYLAAITNFYDCDSRSHKGVWGPDFPSQAEPLILIFKQETFWIPRESNFWFYNIYVFLLSEKPISNSRELKTKQTSFHIP